MSHDRPGSGEKWITIDVVVPVYNESRDLESSIRRLRRYLDTAFPFDATITIADNASTDDTWAIACSLAHELQDVRALHLDRKGRGRALRAAWSRSDAGILSYMDVDLSTSLDALLPLVAPLASGHSELSIGTRLAKGSRVVRGPKRELISRAYNALLRALLHARFSDAQCGFKAIRATEARQLLPVIADEEWFFDTELLVLAERNGLRIHEVPVDWSDDPDSRVHLGHTAIADLKGIARLLALFARGGGWVESIDTRRHAEDLADLGRFGGLGLLNPVGYVAAYLLSYLVLNTFINSYVANVLALTCCTAGTFIAHRLARPRGSDEFAGNQTVAGMALAASISVVATTWSLAAASSISKGSLSVEVAALVVGSAVAAAARFLLRRASTLHVHLRETTPADRITTSFGAGPQPPTHFSSTKQSVTSERRSEGKR
jgi:glycosyltransferase involved in cell wall biosynthesis